MYKTRTSAHIHKVRWMGGHPNVNEYPVGIGRTIIRVTGKDVHDINL